MTSIATTLGIGSGIDTATLIDQLSNASKAPKEAAIKTRQDANTAQISSMGKAANSLDSFNTALASLISGGTLFTQPTTSDGSVLTATAIAGARVGGLSAQIEVVQLAKAQTLSSSHLAGLVAPVGLGTLTLATAKGSFNVVIDATNNSLTGLSRAINAANAGVTASIVEDTSGARLVVKGATGADQAFTLFSGSYTAVVGGADLSRFFYDPNVSGGMTLSQGSQNAKVKLDGVEVQRANNSFTDLVAGVTIDLKAAKPGTLIALGATRPTEAIKLAVSDFVSAYNELKGILDEATANDANGTTTGPLRGDATIRQMQQQLARLTSTKLSSTGGPATLAEIGVQTQRDGTLTVNASVLDATLAADPDGVEALFNPGQTSSSPLVTITSAKGRTKPGTYTLTGLVASANGNPASGTIAGVAAISANDRLVAAIGSPANGLVIDVAGDVASATVTVDLGIGGALQAIRDAMLAANGPIKTAQTRLASETTQITDDKTRMESKEQAYVDRLTKQFSTMETRVSAYKATQSYLEQQIAIWTNKDN